MNLIELFVFGTALSILNVIFQICSHNAAVNNNLLKIKPYHIIKLNFTSQLFAPLGGLFLVPFISISYAMLKVKSKIILKMILMEFLLAILSLILIALTTGVFLYFWFGNNIILDSLIYFQNKLSENQILQLDSSDYVLILLFISLIGIGIYTKLKTKSKYSFIDKFVEYLRISPLKEELKEGIQYRYIVLSLLMSFAIWSVEATLLITFTQNSNFEVFTQFLFAICVSYVFGLVSLVPAGFITREIALYVIIGRYFSDDVTFLLAVSALRGSKILGSIAIGFIPITKTILKLNYTKRSNKI
jgi:hypothetical protein